MLVIVIPTKDRLELLKRAIKSVLDQEFQDYRLVVVDDGSSDRTGEYLKSLDNPKVEVIRHQTSMGVNASRNEAFKRLSVGEWAVPLDDDDLFLPGAFDTIQDALKAIPENIQIAQFGTIMKTRKEEYVGGRDFLPGEEYYDLTYEELITDVGHRMRGEPRGAYKWTLFPKYLFNEDINGFEGEWWLKVSKDDVGIRIFKTKPIVLIDWAHTEEHLSDTASKRDPGSFARAHKRIMEEHAEFLKSHPSRAAFRAKHATKTALVARNYGLALYFAWAYVAASVRSIFLKD